MKSLDIKNPKTAMLLTFLFVSLGGSLVGFIWGLLIMWRNPCERISASDPCDGPAMAAGALWIVSMMASILVGGIASVVIFTILERRAMKPK